MGVKRQPGMVPKALQKAGFEFPQICSSSIHRRCGKDSFATRRSTEMAEHGRWSHLTISEILLSCTIIISGQYMREWLSIFML